MSPQINVTRPAVAVALAVFAVAALSPDAHAGSRRYKRVADYCPPPVRHVHHAPQRVVYVERRSDAAPLVAGLIGGLIIGSAIAHATSPEYEPAHYYWDPWCHERFSSLRAYHLHTRHHHHPRVVRVIAIENGDCIDTWRWYDGGWRNDFGGRWRYSARVHGG